MTFVVDASVVGAWLIEDEATSRTEALLDRYAREGARSPNIIVHEIRSITIKAVRRKRLTVGDAELLLRRFEALRLGDAGVADSQDVFRLALRHGLTAYDAAYLAAAMSERLPLATLDTSLRAAAAKEGVLLFPERT